MKRVFALAVLLLICAAAFCLAQERSGKVVFAGSGAPVGQAIVDFSSAGTLKARAVTIDDGSFYIPALANGSYNVTITYRGVKRVFARTVPQGGLTFVIAP